MKNFGTLMTPARRGWNNKENRVDGYNRVAEGRRGKYRLGSSTTEAADGRLDASQVSWESSNLGKQISRLIP